ncbi:MAG: dihydropteroate synthase [candidate division Zixibacteria bacterium]|nr:dihydropteroate synthase [candidate division Zixibacteria bacterium]
MNPVTLANGKEIEFSSPRIMGIVNCTPDSFAVRSDTPEKAIEAARKMIAEGADLLDIGGESSRPGSKPVSLEEELRRVIPVIEGIRTFSEIPISIDTTKSAVARTALDTGADIINDISALTFDNRMSAIVRDYNCPVVLMHIKGIPKTMQKAPFYDDVVQEVGSYFQARIDFAVSHGIDKRKLILDIGIGFGKRTEDNLKLLKHLQRFAEFGLPLLVGASRKRFIGEITGAETEDRLPGSITVVALAVLNGANIIRVHDVAETKQAVDLAVALREV